MAQGNLTVVFGAAMAGAVLLKYGLRDVSSAFAGTGSNTPTPTTTVSTTPGGNSGNTPSTAITIPPVARNVKLSGGWQPIQAAIAAAHGWSLADWNKVIADESNGNPNALNSQSGAYGIGQFLGSTKVEYTKYGASSSNPVDQILAMAQYISDRYQNPTNALAHENAYHWY